MGKHNIYLTVIIPCYNEKENLEQGVLQEVYNYLQTLPFEWELIISDDGSSDDSMNLVAKFTTGKNRITVLKNPHGGKPAAVHQGVKAAQGQFLLFTDMDQSTPLQELAKLLPYFAQYPVIIGSRIERKNFPLYRQIGSQVFKGFRKAMMLRKIEDTQCGFKVFQTKLAQELFPKLYVFQQKDEVKGWKVTSFDVELLHLVEVRHLKIKEVQVEWEDRDLAKGKERNYLKESKEMLFEILRVKYQDLRGVYREDQPRKK